ncbi:hypothetical protein BC332_31532 [Capsicum chinense]|nr:hypothetical protein BC332_31532 [Capsicum chinense]
MEEYSFDHKFVQVNGINMHVVEKGKGPVVLFIHGFPELWYSWRHQISFMAEHGYRAVAPDLRGYGDTTGVPTDDPSNFSCLRVVGDLVELVNTIAPEQDEVFVVGHDWGAMIAWYLCLFRPDKVKALVNMSVPFSPRNPNAKPVETFKAILGDDFYVVRFQEPGKVEAEYAKIGTKKVLGKLYIPNGKPFDDSPVILPCWLSEKDIDYYASKYEKTGFTGGLNYYRALDLDREDIDPRSKYVIPKLIKKLGELENLVESSQYIDNHASINEVEKVELNKFVEETSHEVDKPKESKDDNCVDMKLEKLEEEVEKIKEREKKWRRIAKFVVFCCSPLLIVISYWLGMIHIKKGSMRLP